MKFYRTLLSLLVGLMAPCAWALDFNYQMDGSPSSKWGSQKRDTYDVAVRVRSACLTGMRITSVSVPLDAPSASSATVWLSSELKLKKVNGVKSNDPDILTVDATIGEDGILRATLPDGYTIPAEGVYVGYSFSLTDVQEADKNPVAVYQGMNEDGLWVHTVRSYFNWESLSAKLGLVSAMQITLDGELPTYGIGITAAKDVYAQSGEPMVLDVQVANHGTQPLDSFTYRYTLPSGEGEGTYRFTEPIQPYFNAVHNVSLTLPVAGERGSSQGAIAITGVQNQMNGEDEPLPFTMRVLQFKPKRRVVMEEYTATTCGWCPRGSACIEHLSHDYPDDFIGIAYHTGGVMYLGIDLLNSGNGLPNSQLNRSKDIDPGYATIFPLFMALRDKLPEANIDVKAVLEGNTIKATSTSYFLDNHTAAPYKLAYVLIADSLMGTDSSWIQANYYSGQQQYAEDDSYLQPYIDGENHLSGHPFSNIAVYCKDQRGLPGTLPAEITADTPIESTTEIALADVLNFSGESLMQEQASYRLAALSVDGSTGAIINGGVCPVEGLAAAIRSIGCEQAHGSVRYYNLQGERVDSPRHGIYIKVEGGRASKIAL